ncbi:MAG: hypothetical protein ABR529_10090 [Actinomycetota bacterium]
MTTRELDRSALWLDLMRRVTQSCPRAAVHGHVAEGFAGEGDVDLLVPESEWAVLEREFDAWARRSLLGPVVACRHRAGVLILVALADEGAPFFELEARARRFFKGSTLYVAQDFGPVLETAPDGYRRVRAGAAGLLKLVPNGLARGGGLKWKGAKAERVGRLLAEDPDGVRVAAELFALPRGPLVAAADSMAHGGWDRRAVLVLQASAAARGVLELPTLVARARARLGPGGRCLVLETIGKHKRRVPGDRREWLRRAAVDHRVDGAGSVGPRRP